MPERVRGRHRAPTSRRGPRRARYDVLPEGVLTGHTADDQAETVLLNLLRGAGADGLAGMRAHGRISRPLLGLRRHETRRLCDELSLPTFEDPSNTDLAFRRNRVRHGLLPLMAELSGRDPVPVLARQARLLADDVALLDELAAGIDPSDAPPSPPPGPPWPAGLSGGGCGPTKARNAIRLRRRRSSGSWPWPGARRWPASWPAAAG